jgi:hypothetical protein
LLPLWARATKRRSEYIIERRPVIKLTWFILRVAFWLALASLFVPGLMPLAMIDAGHPDLVVERAVEDTLTSADRAASWRGLRIRN